MVEWYEWICFRGCNKELMMGATRFKQYLVHEASLWESLRNQDKMAQILSFPLEDFNNVRISHVSRTSKVEIPP